MKRILSLLLALTLALALAIPASADDQGIGVIGGADGPTFIITAESTKATAQQREQAIRSLGGTPGQTNVLFGGRCIAFTDAAPEAKDGRTMVPLRAALEAMGATVDYEQATKTVTVTGEKASFTHVIGSDVITLSDGTEVKMDVASYATASNRTMIPVRFFSQVLGYDVYWDNDYKLVFLLDEDAFVHGVDSQFAVLNAYLSRCVKNYDFARNHKEEMKLSGTVKVIDSINGDRSYKYSGNVAVLLGKDGMSMDLTADLGELVGLVESVSGSALPVEYREPLTKLDFSLRLGGDKVYFKSALLDVLMASEGGAQGAWYAADLGMDYADYYTSVFEKADQYTVGHILYSVMQQGDANHFFDSWNGVSELSSMLASLMGDGTFTKSGADYRWHFGASELAKFISELTGESFTEQDAKDAGVEELSADMRINGTSVEASYKAALNVNEEAALRVEYTLTGDQNRMSAKGSVQVRNVCDVTFQADVTVRATNERVSTVPPTGAAVVDLSAAGQSVA